MRKILVVLSKLALLLMLTACGTDTTSTNEGDRGERDFDYSNIKIGFLGHVQSGETLDALTAYLDSISEEVGFSYEYVVGSSYDEQTNLTAAQNLIASGVDGIITTLDSGAEAILQEAESAGVYLAGFLNDMDSSFDELKSSEYYLGNVCDGLYDNASIGEKAAELIIADGKKNVGVVSFPLNYFPQKAGAIESFINEIEEHNKNTGDQIEIYDTEILSFTALEDNYFNNHPDIDSIFSLASGFVHPTMVSAGKTDVSLYSTGFKIDDYEAFEAGEIRLMTLSNIEAVVYPLSMMLNEITGMPYEDKPHEAERVDTSILFITNMDELNTLAEKSLYYTADIENAFISAKDFTQYLTTHNPNANYSDLKEDLMKMSIEDLANK